MTESRIIICSHPQISGISLTSEENKRRRLITRHSTFSCKFFIVVSLYQSYGFEGKIWFFRESWFFYLELTFLGRVFQLNNNFRVDLFPRERLCRDSFSASVPVHRASAPWSQVILSPFINLIASLCIDHILMSQCQYSNWKVISSLWKKLNVSHLGKQVALVLV